MKKNILKKNIGHLSIILVVGSAAYNLLMICALCIAAIKAPETRRIKLYNVFLVI
jgi:hypothetical protein